MEWYPLRDKVVEVVGEFSLNVYAYAISFGNECLICSTFFRKILKDAGHDPDNMKLDETSNLLIDYAKACISKPAEVSGELFKRMRTRFNEEQIVLLTAFAGIMIATNLINTALDVPLDDYLTEYTKK
jgi:alkylhydroperoxidase family enzyme